MFNDTLEGQVPQEGNALHVPVFITRAVGFGYLCVTQIKIMIWTSRAGLKPIVPNWAPRLRGPRARV